MNNFFTHPMRPFFVGAAILAIVGALSFFINPDDLILHRKIFLEFMLPAAYGGFLTASMLEWTNYKGNLKPIATILAVLLLSGLVLLPFSPQAASFLVAAYWLALLLFLCLAVLVGSQYRQFYFADVTCRIYSLSDGLRHD